jgi:hypothetical protein
LLLVALRLLLLAVLLQLLLVAPLLLRNTPIFHLKYRP